MKNFEKMAKKTCAYAGSFLREHAHEFKSLDEFEEFLRADFKDTMACPLCGFNIEVFRSELGCRLSHRCTNQEYGMQINFDTFDEIFMSAKIFLTERMNRHEN